MPIKTNAERETIICKAMDEDTWHVFSETPTHIRKLERLHGPGKPKGGGYVWRIPPDAIVFRKGGSTPENSPRKASEHLAKWRFKAKTPQAEALPSPGA